MAVPGAHKGGKRNMTRRNKSKGLKKTLRKKRRNKSKRKSNKGGFVLPILEQAVVPFGLFALQKKMQNRKKTTSTKKVSKRKLKK